MVRKSNEQRAFEKSRKDILKLSEKEVGKEEEQKYAWEIELEEYRSRKRMDRFLMFGAFCGILSLLISLYVLYGHVYGM